MQRGRVHGREERQLHWGVCGTGEHAGAATMTLGAMLADARPGGTLRGIREW